MATAINEKTCGLDEQVREDRLKKRQRDIQTIMASVRYTMCAEPKPCTPNPYSDISKRDWEHVKINWKKAMCTVPLHALQEPEAAHEEFTPIDTSGYLSPIEEVSDEEEGQDSTLRMPTPPTPIRLPTPPPPDTPPPLRLAPEFFPGASFWGSIRCTGPASLVWLGGIPDELLPYAGDEWRRFQ